MSINWDELVLGPAMAIFGEGNPAGDEDQLPLYTPRLGAPFRLADAVFDREHAEVVVDGDGVPSTSRRPVLGVRLSLFERPPEQNEKVFIPSVGLPFLVKDVQPDGHGFAKLVLMVTR